MADNTRMTERDAAALLDAWRAIRDGVQGRATVIGGDDDYYLRVDTALRAIAAKILCDNLALGNHLAPGDPAIEAEAIAFAERQIADLEMSMLDAGILPPAPPRCPDGECGSGAGHDH